MAEKGKAVATKELRIFGCGLGVILLALALLMFWRGLAHGGSAWRYYTADFLAVFGGVFLMFGVLVPKSLTPVYLLWMPVAGKIGAFNTQVLLFLTFWLVFGPVAIMRRLTGADDLRLKDVPRDTYFVPKKQVPVTLESCRRQF